MVLLLLLGFSGVDSDRTRRTGRDVVPGRSLDATAIRAPADEKALSPALELEPK